MKKAFFDSVEAVKTLQAIPKDDLLRILSVIVPPPLNGAFADFVAEMNQLDLALLAVGFCNSFHSGYSTAIADGSENRNIHVDYVNEQSVSAARTAPAGQSRPNA